MRDFLKDLRIVKGELNDLVRELPQLAGAEALESIDDNFRNQGFFGTPWLPRQQQEGNDGKAILVQSGRLRRSFNLQVSGLTLIIHTDTPYAEIHNEGGTISGTANVAAYTRKRFSTHEENAPIKKDGSRDERYKNRTVKSLIGTHQVKAHTRTMNTTIPQRQFMGDHPAFDAKLEKLLEHELDRIFDS